MRSFGNDRDGREVIKAIKKYLSGSWSIGPVTLYGENAMHWAVNVRTKKGYLCFRLPLRCFGKWLPLYCYFSPDGTPRKATKWWWGEGSA